MYIYLYNLHNFFVDRNSQPLKMYSTSQSCTIFTHTLETTEISQGQWTWMIGMQWLCLVTSVFGEGWNPRILKNPQTFPPKKKPKQIEKKKNNKNIPNWTKKSKIKKRRNKLNSCFYFWKEAVFLGWSGFCLDVKHLWRGPPPTTLPGKKSRMYPLQKGIVSKGKDCLPATFFLLTFVVLVFGRVNVWRRFVSWINDVFWCLKHSQLMVCCWTFNFTPGLCFFTSEAWAQQHQRTGGTSEWGAT